MLRCFKDAQIAHVFVMLPIKRQQFDNPVRQNTIHIER